MLGNRNAQHSFAQVPDIHLTRSQFDRSFAVKDTFDFDYLIPVYLDEVLPGDTFNVQVNTFARLATMKVPVMDNLYVDYFFFYVPKRLVFENWTKLLGVRENVGDSIDFVMPTLTFPAGGPEVGSIFDKFGLPTDVAAGYTIKNSLPLRCYPFIWNEWFRDQNLQDAVPVPKDDGPDVPADFTLLKRGRRHDYFTSLLPWPQKGPAVMLPLGTSAPVIGNGAAVTFGTVNDSTDRGLQAGPHNGVINAVMGTGGLLASSSGFVWHNTGLEADFSSATAATINQLREAFAIQGLLERDARGGSRYPELMRSHFGVDVPDYTIQRPEYLGGGSTRMNVHPVAGSASDNQAELAAFATASTMGERIGFSKTFVEHGYVIGLVCARGEQTYQQGLHRLWNRSTRWDFYDPALEGLGEQAVLSKELYLDGTGDDEDVLGYAERWSEYKFKPSEIHGQFRSTYATPLDQWHVGEHWSARPVLNGDFIVQNTPIERSIAVPSAPHILFDAWFSQRCARPMHVFSTPVSLGRF